VTKEEKLSVVSTRLAMKLPAKDPVSNRVYTVLLLCDSGDCETGEIVKGMSLGSVETGVSSIDEVLRLYKCVPLCFFAFCCVFAAEAAFLEEDDEEEEEDDEEEDDLRALLGTLGM
jgi:hypothetical protein